MSAQRFDQFDFLTPDYDAMARSEAVRQGVDPYLISAALSQESGGKPGARSRKGAMGLMQIMPATAARLARDLGTTPDAVLNDPATNLKAGVYEWKRLLLANQGHPDPIGAAAVGYNAGEGEIGRYDAGTGHHPFAETRNYIASIKSKMGNSSAAEFDFLNVQPHQATATAAGRPPTPRLTDEQFGALDDVGKRAHVANLLEDLHAANPQPPAQTPAQHRADTVAAVADHLVDEFDGVIDHQTAVDFLKSSQGRQHTLTIARSVNGNVAETANMLQAHVQQQGRQQLAQALPSAVADLPVKLSVDQDAATPVAPDLRQVSPGETVAVPAGRVTSTMATARPLYLGDLKEQIIGGKVDVNSLTDVINRRIYSDLGEAFRLSPGDVQQYAKPYTPEQVKAALPGIIAELNDPRMNGYITHRLPADYEAQLSALSQGKAREFYLQQVASLSDDDKRLLARSLAAKGPLPDDLKKALGYGEHEFHSAADIPAVAGDYLGAAGAGAMKSVGETLSGLARLNQYNPTGEWAVPLLDAFGGGLQEEGNLSLNTSKPRGVGGAVAQGAGELAPDLAAALLLPEALPAHLAFWGGLGATKELGRGGDLADAGRAGAINAAMVGLGAPLKPVAGAAADSLGEILAKGGTRAFIGAATGYAQAKAQGASDDEALAAAIQFAGMNLAGGKRAEDRPLSIAPEAVRGDSLAPVDVAAHEAATSPRNDMAAPTPAQVESGNYAKGHTRIAGMDITIENPQGSTRRPEWPPLDSHYGYLKGSSGADGEHIDVFVKPGTPANYDGPVYVVDQLNKGGKFDEHKVMLGWPTKEEASAGYAANYTPDWQVGPIREFSSPAEFKAWLKSGDTTKPAATEAAPVDFDFLTPQAEPLPARGVESAAYGSRNRLVTSDAATAALERIRARGVNERGSGGPSTEQLADLLTLAAYHVEAGAREFGAFSSRMIADAGEWIKPHLAELHDKALAMVGGSEREAPRIDDAPPAPTEPPAASNAPVKLRQHPLEVVSTLIKSGLLSGLQTSARNILSTVSHLAAEGGPTRAIASLTDILVAGREGVRSITGPNPAATMRAAGEAATTGLREAWDIIKRGAPENELDRLANSREISTGSKVGDLIVNFPFRFLSAQDRVMKTFAFRNALEDRARAEALSESRAGRISGESVEGLTRDLVRAARAGERDDLLLNAWQDAEIATFNNANKLGENLQRVKSEAGPVGKFVIDQAALFASVPWNVLRRQLDGMGLGFGVEATKALARRIQGEAFPTLEDQRRFATMAGRLGTGAAVAMLGAYLHNAGVLTGYNEEGGKPSASMLIGGRYYRVDLVPPFGALLALGATLRGEMTRELGKGESRSARAAGAVAESLVPQHPFARPTRDFVEPMFEAAQKRSFGPLEKSAESLAGRLVPSISAEVARAGDASERDVRGPLDAMKARIPGLREQLPAKRDGLGDVVERSGAPGFAGGMADIFRSVPDKAAVDRIVREMQTAGVDLKPLQRGQTETDAHFQRRADVVGKMMHERLSALVDSPAYAELSPGLKKLLLVRVRNEAKQDYREQAKGGRIATPEAAAWNVEVTVAQMRAREALNDNRAFTGLRPADREDVQRRVMALFRSSKVKSLSDVRDARDTLRDVLMELKESISEIISDVKEARRQ